jgi:hypothetical protein
MILAAVASLDAASTLKLPLCSFTSPEEGHCEENGGGEGRAGKGGEECAG